VDGQVDVPVNVPVEAQEVRRWRHPSGMQGLVVRQMLRVPTALDPAREARSSESVVLPVLVEARITPGLRRIDLRVEVENTARDHRLRLLFPAGSPAGGALEEFHAASTFDAARRSTAARDDTQWIHPAPRTFPSQGWICAGGLTLAAPGLPEAEVTPEGDIAITLVRAVGWLSRPDLHSRPGGAGPALATPGAQCLERFEARLSLFDGGPELAATRARDAELGLRAAAAGPETLLPDGQALLQVNPPELLLSALKPAQRALGSVLRLLNPTDREIQARIDFGFELAGAETVRLDESPASLPLSLEARRIGLSLPPHALRSVLFRAATHESSSEDSE
jgi:mannosylglycerate hydrolase